MRDGEKWDDVAGSFVAWCVKVKKLARGGCHEGALARPLDAQRYAAIAIPDHSPDLVVFLREWAAAEGRRIE